MISKKAKLLEKAIGNIGIKNIVSKMMLNPNRFNKYEEPPKNFLRKYNTQSFKINDRNCFSINSTENPSKHILYFHGGAYTMQANKMHWQIIDYILKEIQCTITFVDYPLVPEYTCIDTINMVINVYSYLCNSDNQEIILMGDSAGGGLALALAQYVNSNNLMPKPSKIVLFSPWLDVSMENDITEDQATKDLILDKDTLKIIGNRYAGDLSNKDYLCSPLYGNVAHIGEIALFTGTSEILNTQAKILKDKVLIENGSLSYHEYENMQHVWVGFPIPEAKDAMEKVCAFIKK